MYCKVHSHRIYCSIFDIKIKQFLTQPIKMEEWCEKSWCFFSSGHSGIMVRCCWWYTELNDDEKQYFLYSFLLKKNKEGVKLRMRFCISFFWSINLDRNHTNLIKHNNWVIFLRLLFFLNVLRIIETFFKTQRAKHCV